MWGIIVGLLVCFGGFYVSNAYNGGLLGVCISIVLAIFLASKVK